jgi:uncharacterized membrane protein YeaQ/YmgE (transglycosylase-associated protein family)
MSWVAWIVLGLVAGFIASRVVNRAGAGLVGNVLVGVLGAYAGGYLFSHFGAPGVTGFNLWSVLVASVGAMALLAVYNLSFGR